MSKLTLSKYFVLIVSAAVYGVPGIAEGASCPSTPTYINPNLKIECGKSQKGALLTSACEESGKFHHQAFDSAQEAYKKICQASAALRSKSNGGNSDASQSYISNVSGSAKSTANAVIQQLQDVARSQKEQQQALLGEANTATTNAQSYISMHAVEPDVVKKEASRLPDDTGTKTVNEKFESHLLTEQLATYNALAQSQSQISKEIQKLQDQVKSLDTLGTTTAALAKKAGPTPDPNASSGDQAKKSDESGSSGGGSGGGGSGSGGGQSSGSPSQQSGITDPLTAQGGSTSPTPNATNPGGPSSTADGGQSSRPGTADTSKNSPAASTTGAQGTHLSAVRASAPASEQDDAGARRSSSSGGASTASAGGGGSGATSSGASLKGDAKSDTVAAKASTGPSSGGGGGSSGGGGADGGSGDDALAPFAKPLTDQKFSLAGSDTDASVKNMVGSFNTGDSPEPNRDPASEVNDGVGERNGPELWDRVHDYHKRCAQTACVAFARRRGGGGR